MTEYTDFITADSITDELLNIVEYVVEGWYSDTRIDWENVWDRVEATPLSDWSMPNLGSEIDSPAMQKIKHEIRKRR